MRYNYLFSLFAVVCIVAVSSPALCQVPKPVWTSYHNTDNAIQVLDQGNYIWTSTWGGIARFRKSDHQALYFPSDVNGTLAVGPDSRVWSFGTSLSLFDGNSWIRYPLSADKSEQLWISSIAFDRNGVIWLAGTNGLQYPRILYFDGTSVKRFAQDSALPRCFIDKMFTDRAGNVWGTCRENPSGPDYSRFDNSIVFRINTSGFKIWKQEDGLPTNQYSGLFTNIVQDSTGNVWVSRFTGASHFDGAKWNLITQNSSPGVLQSGAASMLVDKLGNLWFFGYSVNKYDGKNWTTDFGELPVRITDFALSSSGDVWIFGYTGAARYDGSKFVKADGLPDSVCYSAVPDSKGEILIGTRKGIARLSGNNWSQYIIGNTPSGNEIGPMAVDKSGNLWLARMEDNAERISGVDRYDGNNWKQFTHADGAPDSTNGVAVDLQGTPWFSGQHTLSHWSQGSWSQFAVSDERKNTRTYDALAIDSNGTIWLACNTETPVPGSTIHLVTTIPEVIQYRNGEWKIFGSESIHFLPGFGITHIAATGSGEVWADGFQQSESGTHAAIAGLYHYDGTQWHTIDLDDRAADLIHIEPRDIVSANDGSVWISYQYALADNNKKLLGPIVHYDGKTWKHYGGIKNQLPGQYIEYMTIAPNGHIVASTEMGISEFDGANWTLVYSLAPETIPDRPASIAYAPDGSTWFGSVANGIYHYSPNGASAVSAIVHMESGLTLSIYPNPIISASCHLDISSATAGLLDIGLYNDLGNEVEKIFEGAINANSHRTITFDLTSLVPGTYFLRSIGVGGTMTMPVMRP